MRALDTSAEAAAIQEAIHRRLGPAKRLKIALELSDLAKSFAIAGLRLRHPEYSERDAIRVLAEQLYRKTGNGIS
jgi:hypothetical protein